MTRLTASLCLFILGFNLSLSAQVSVLDNSSVVGKWKLVQQTFGDLAYDKENNARIAKGENVIWIEFDPNLTYVQSYSDWPVKVLGKWDVDGNRILTTNNRFSPLQDNAVAAKSSYFSDVEIIGDTLKMTAQSESVGTSYFLKMK